MKNKIISFCIVIAFIFGGIFVFKEMFFNDHAYTITVSDKERVYDNKSSRYLIYTKINNSDEKVFEDTDNLLRFKFNSSDIFARLEKGKTYKIDVIGYRVPFLSWYENIVSIE